MEKTYKYVPITVEYCDGKTNELRFISEKRAIKWLDMLEHYARKDDEAKTERTETKDSIVVVWTRYYVKIKYTLTKGLIKEDEIKK